MAHDDEDYLPIWAMVAIALLGVALGFFIFQLFEFFMDWPR